jgi:lysozyme
MLQNYDLIESVKKHEGFKNYPYIDPLVKANPEMAGIPKKEFGIIEKHFNKLKITFGIGFTFISEEEAKVVLQIRLNNIKNQLKDKLSWFEEQPETVQNVLIEMAYQMGVSGVLSFKKMLEAIKTNNYIAAAKEGIRSRWFIQTRSRASELMKKLASLED